MSVRDLADALANLLEAEDPRWDMELSDDLWNHDVFDDADEEYRFLRSVIEDQPPGVAWAGIIDADAVVAKLLPVEGSQDAIVLLDPDVRPAGVLEWHPFFNLMRLSPEGKVVWRSEFMPGDTWKVFLDVEWQEEVLRASAASYNCTLDPETGRIIETTFVN